MASDSEDCDQSIETLKANVRQSFARVYATLKARELKTIRQLDALSKQCESDKELMRNCLQNTCISYDNETSLLDHIRNFGCIDFEKLNFDSNIFTLEDYVKPEDDHMYSYKTIEELTKEDPIKDLEAIEEAALKQIISNELCVCTVDLKAEEISKKFRDLDTSPVKESRSESSHSSFDKEVESLESLEEKSDDSEVDVKKIDPTDDWLNSIKNHTETEPTQSVDVMEHSTIACS